MVDRPKGRLTSGPGLNKRRLAGSTSAAVAAKAEAEAHVRCVNGEVTNITC